MSTSQTYPSIENIETRWCLLFNLSEGFIRFWLTSSWQRSSTICNTKGIFTLNVCALQSSDHYRYVFYCLLLSLSEQKQTIIVLPSLFTFQTTFFVKKKMPQNSEVQKWQQTIKLYKAQVDRNTLLHETCCITNNDTTTLSKRIARSYATSNAILVTSWLHRKFQHRQQRTRV